MFASALLAAFLGAASVLAFPLNPDASFDLTVRRDCGTTISPEQTLTTERNFKALTLAKSLAKTENNTQAGPAVVQVHFHVISEDDTPDGGNVPDFQIQDQIDVLNQDYTKSGLSFTLVNTTRTIDPETFNQLDMAGPLQARMQQNLRVGGADTLNIYSVGFKAGNTAGLLGFASFPWDFRENPTSDGIVLRFSSLPGGALPVNNLGKTLTHEVGHWAGLHHTFGTGGCGGDGDFVDDTPISASPSFGCPTGRDSCSGSGGDPIHNFMDYSDDSCLTEFTPGQLARMAEALSVFRGIETSPVSPASDAASGDITMPIL